MNKEVLKCRIKELWLIARYYSFIPMRKKAKPVIIIMFDNKMMHGGLLDRMKGLITAKIISEKLGYDFKIFTNTAFFNLYRYLIPINNNTIAKAENIHYNLWVSKPIVIYNIFSLSQKNIVAAFLRNKEYHLYCNTDLLKNIISFPSQKEYEAFWRKSFFEIFKFDEYFFSYFKTNFDASKEVCGMHLRFTSLLGDFEEVNNKPLPEQEKRALIQKCINNIFQIISTTAFQQYLIVSDSLLFLKTLKEKTSLESVGKKILILEGAIGHIDIRFEESVLQKTILDFYLLYKCKTIYQVLGEKMYNSQFSKYAAILGGAEYCLKKI